MKNLEESSQDPGHKLSAQEVREAILRGLSSPEGLEKDVYGDTTDGRPLAAELSKEDLEAITTKSAPADADGWVTLSLPPRPEDPMAK